MSLSDQESRLAELKQLQEQLQTKLLSQLSSSACNEDTISEEMRLEIIQTLNDPSRLLDDNDYQSMSSLNNNNTTIESVTQHYQQLSLSSQNPASIQTYDHDNSSCCLSERESDVSNTSHIDSYNKEESNCRPTPIEACHTPAIVSTGFLSHPDYSGSEIEPEDTSVKHLQNGTDGLCVIEDSSCTMTLPSIATTSKDTEDTLTIAEMKQNTNEEKTNNCYYDTCAQDDHCGDPGMEELSDQEINYLSSLQTASITCQECIELQTYVDQLFSENKQWRFECGRLEHQLDQCMSITNSFTEKNEKLLQQTVNYQEECQSKEQLVSLLRSKITTLTGHVEAHVNVITELKERNTELEEELGCVVRERKDLRDLLSQTDSEMDNKTDEITRLEDNINDMKSQLYITESDINELNTTMGLMKDRENQFQSTIHSMEEEIKSLQIINNRLNSQSTHFQISDYSYQDHTPNLINVCDETKMMSPHSKEQRNTSLLLSPREHNNIITKRPLTRKKWLESSDGGFIFGSPSVTDSDVIKEDKENVTTSYSPRTPSRNHHPSSRTHQDTENTLQHSPVENVLQSIRDGKVTSNEKTARRLSTKSQQQSPKERIDQQVEARLQMIPIVEKKLEELQKEKEKLEHILQRAPPTRKVSAQLKQMMMDAELRLEATIKEIGTARLYLLGSPSWKK